MYFEHILSNSSHGQQWVKSCADFGHTVSVDWAREAHRSDYHWRRGVDQYWFFLEHLFWCRPGFRGQHLGVRDVISWRSRITFVLHSAKSAWFTVVTCAKLHVLCNIWSVMNFKVQNIIRISYTFKMTFSLIINWYPINLHSCVLMNFVWSVKNFILCILRPVLDWYFANCYNIAIDIQINVVQL